MDGGAWRATVHGVSKSWTQMNDYPCHIHPGGHFTLVGDWDFLKDTIPGCVPGCSVLSKSLRPCGLQPARLLFPWDSPGKNTGVGCHFLHGEGIFTTQGSNLLLLHWQAGSLPVR